MNIEANDRRLKKGVLNGLTDQVRLFHGVAPDDWTEVDLGGLMPGTGYVDWIAVGPQHAIIRAEVWGNGPSLNLQIVGVPEA